MTKVTQTYKTILNLDKASIYQEENRILYNVNLNVRENEFIYLIGKTGSGKSSLLKTLYGELPLTEGKGSIMGFNLTKLEKKQIPFLRRNIGIVFQDFQLLTDRNVEDNLAFVLKATGWQDKAEMNLRIDQVLAEVGLLNKRKQMPFRLSGGEQQRICIARALLNMPKIILADEPTGNLDPETSLSIMKLLIEISKNNSSIIIATHDYRLFEMFPSRTWKCDGGIVIDSDTL